SSHSLSSHSFPTRRSSDLFQLFWRVTLPMLTPTIFFTAVISILNSFQVFDLAFILTGGGPGKDSYTIVYHIYHLGFENATFGARSEEHTSELQSPYDLVCR